MHSYTKILWLENVFTKQIKEVMLKMKAPVSQVVIKSFTLIDITV